MFLPACGLLSDEPMKQPSLHVIRSSVVAAVATCVATLAAVQVPDQPYRSQSYPWKIAQRLDSGRIVVMLSSDDDYDLTEKDKATFGDDLGPAAARFLIGTHIAPMEWVHRVTGSDARIGDAWEVDGGRFGWFSASIEQGVTTMAGCGANGALLARVNADRQPAFSAISDKYFLARPHEGWSRPDRTTAVGPVAFSLMSAQRVDLESLLAREAVLASQRVIAVEASQSHGDVYEQTITKWKGIYARLAQGEATLTYDVQAFRLTPDREPRLFVRARWHMDGRPVFLLGAWVRVGKTLSIESSDTSASRYPWFDEFRFEGLDLTRNGAVLNVTDVDRDGFAEVLMLNVGYESVGLQGFRYPPARDGKRTIIATFGAGC